MAYLKFNWYSLLEDLVHASLYREKWIFKDFAGTTLLRVIS